MPIEIRELVIKATVTDRDDDRASGTAYGETSTGIAEQGQAGRPFPQAEILIEAITKILETGDIEMPMYMELKGFKGEATNVSDDTLEFDLDNIAASIDEDFTDETFGLYTTSFEAVLDDTAGGEWVAPDLALTDVDADEYGGGTLTHEVGHWLG